VHRDIEVKLQKIRANYYLVRNLLLDFIFLLPILKYRAKFLAIINPIPVIYYHHLTQATQISSLILIYIW
jgi:hypothetical protein